MWIAGPRSPQPKQVNLQVSDFEDELANALYGFKLELDARPNRATKRTSAPGIQTRESSFESQLRGPDPRLADVPSVPPTALCGSGGGAPTPITVTFSGIPGIFNGSFVLPYVGGDGATTCTWFIQVGGVGENITVGYSVASGFSLVQVEDLSAPGPSTTFQNLSPGYAFGDTIPNQAPAYPGQGTAVISPG